MNELWKNTIITKISAAVYVAPNTGKCTHKNRTFHGFVLNDENNIKDYYFEDGQVLHTEGNALFYLPKGSSYHVISISTGGCYAINFEADISDKPFSFSFRNTKSLLHNFKAATEAWKTKSDTCNSVAMRAVYDAIYQAQKELHKQYIPKKQACIIAPAVEKLNQCFTETNLSISHLAHLCGISEVYFRKLFLLSFGVSPKEYLIQQRIEYAKSLLQSGNFTISETAVLCGYTEPCNFSREFARRVGITPSQYLSNI